MLFRFNDKASGQQHFLPENRLLPFYYSWCSWCPLVLLMLFRDARKTLDIWMSETRVMRFQTFHNLDHFPSFCLIFSKIQFVLSSVSDVQILSVLPFFHTKFNCPSIWTGFKHEKPDPVKIRIFRIFKTGFLPGTAISDFFLYSPTSPMVWEFQNCKAIWINCQFVHLGTGPVCLCHAFGDFEVNSISILQHFGDDGVQRIS